jgi:uncharacterized membrane protein YfhO
LLLYPANRAEEIVAQQLAVECRGKASVSDISFGNNQVEFKVLASGPSWVTVSDLYFPGWQAESDGKPLRIWRANGRYRAVCLPAGGHHVRFYFNPLAFLRSAAARLHAVEIRHKYGTGVKAS